MELWDVYDSKRQLTGKAVTRRESMAAGEYHLIVDVLFINSKGQTLLQQRADGKETHPGAWTFTRGAALAGENSEAALMREVTEELGFVPDMRHAHLIYQCTNDMRGCHRDVWLVGQDMPIGCMQLQKDEVQAVRWVLPEDILAEPVLASQVPKASYWAEVYPRLLLESVKRRIPCGKYRHFKGKEYRVLHIALHSETLEPMVVYQALYDTQGIWVRPYGMWQETVMHDGVSQLRFQKMEETE